MKKFSELTEEILAYELAIQIQEGNITEEEVQDLQEVLPALAIAGKLIGAGLTAYSGYQAAKNLNLLTIHLTEPNKIEYQINKFVI